jgi:hypothetical protein
LPESVGCHGGVAFDGLGQFPGPEMAAVPEKGAFDFASAVGGPFIANACAGWNPY